MRHFRLFGQLCKVIRGPNDMILPPLTKMFMHLGSPPQYTDCILTNK